MLGGILENLSWPILAIQPFIYLSGNQRGFSTYFFFSTCIRAISFIDRDHFISVSYFASR